MLSLPVLTRVRNSGERMSGRERTGANFYPPHGGPLTFPLTGADFYPSRGPLTFSLTLLPSLLQIHFLNHF